MPAAFAARLEGVHHEGAPELGDGLLHGDPRQSPARRDALQTERPTVQLFDDVVVYPFARHQSDEAAHDSTVVLCRGGG